MKVYYLDDIPTPYRLGVFKLVTKTISGEFRVGFCAGEEPGRSWDLDYGDVDYEVLDGFQWRPPFQMNPFSFKFNFSVKKALSSFNPDVVIVSGYSHPTVFLVAWYCRLKNIPFGVVSETNEHCSATQGIRWMVKKVITSPLIKHMSFGLPTGSQAENYFKMMNPRDIPYFHFPNTPDLMPIKKVSEKLQSNEARVNIETKYKLVKDKVSILFVGRLIAAKNPFELLNAYQALSDNKKKDVQIIIVGAGDLGEEIESFAQSNSNIVLIPWLNNPTEVYELMCYSDIFVLPSVHEPWGAVVNEAMGAGCCTVVTDKVGSGYDLIENDVSGYSYQSGEVTQLTKILEKLIDSSDLRQTISIKGMESADSCDQRFAAKNLLDAISYVKEYVKT